MKKLSKLAALGLASSLAMGISAPAQADTNPFVGEIMDAGYNFCPRGYSETAGQLLPIAQHTALFSLLGTTYGGDGRSTFSLPDLRGRSIVGQGRGPGLSSIRWGERSGRETVTLTSVQMPSHNHTGTILGENAVLADSGNPAGNTLARSAASIYSDNSPPSVSAKMHAGTLSIDPAGGSQAYGNRNPFLGMIRCISMTGVYPSRS